MVFKDIDRVSSFCVPGKPQTSLDKSTFYPCMCCIQGMMRLNNTGVSFGYPKKSDTSTKIGTSIGKGLCNNTKLLAAVDSPPSRRAVAWSERGSTLGQFRQPQKPEILTAVWGTGVDRGSKQNMGQCRIVIDTPLTAIWAWDQNCMLENGHLRSPEDLDFDSSPSHHLIRAVPQIQICR